MSPRHPVVNLWGMLTAITPYRAHRSVHESQRAYGIVCCPTEIGNSLCRRTSPAPRLLTCAAQKPRGKSERLRFSSLFRHNRSVSEGVRTPHLYRALALRVSGCVRELAIHLHTRIFPFYAFTELSRHLLKLLRGYCKPHVPAIDVQSERLSKSVLAWPLWLAISRRRIVSQPVMTALNHAPPATNPPITSLT
jgi:hypothetical protein